MPLKRFEILAYLTAPNGFESVQAASRISWGKIQKHRLWGEWDKLQVMGNIPPKKIVHILLLVANPSE